MVILPSSVVLFVLLFVFIVVNQRRLVLAETFVTGHRCSLEDRLEYTTQYIVNQNDDYEQLYKGCSEYVSNVDLTSQQGFIYNEAIHYLGLIVTLSSVLKTLQTDILGLEQFLKDQNDTIVEKTRIKDIYQTKKSEYQVDLSRKEASKEHINYLKSVHDSSENMKNLESVIQGQVCSDMEPNCGLKQNEDLTRQKLMDTLQLYLNNIPEFSKAYLYGVRVYHTYVTTNNRYNELLTEYYKYMILVKNFEDVMYKLVVLFARYENVFYNSNITETRLSVSIPAINGNHDRVEIGFNEIVGMFQYRPGIILNESSTFEYCKQDPVMCASENISEQDNIEYIKECGSSESKRACDSLRQPSKNVSGLEKMYRKKFPRSVVTENDQPLVQRKYVVDNYLAQYFLSKVFPRVG